MKKRKLFHHMPVMQNNCPTCPFSAKKYAALAPHLAYSALTEATRICHCTGTNAIGGRTGKPNRACRGARNIQLRFFASVGFLSEPTDEAWEKKLAELEQEE